MSVHVAPPAKLNLQPRQAGECEAKRRGATQGWQKLGGWKKQRDGGEREMAMSCANDESLCSVLRGDAALGTASPAAVLQLSPRSDLRPLCGGTYRMCVNLLAC